MDVPSRIQAFLAGTSFAVVGASTERRKYGNRCLRCYLQDGREVHPVHPSADEVEGRRAYARLSDLPARPHGVTIVTPPPVTEEVVEEAVELGIEHLWMQLGAESAAAVERAEAAGIQVIAGGPCLLVELGCRD